MSEQSGMTQSLARHLPRALVPLSVALLLAFWPAIPGHADGEPIEIISSEITSLFPDGLLIKVEAKGENEITSVAVRLRVGQRTSGAYDYLCQAPEVFVPEDWRCSSLLTARQVGGELFWRTNTGARYIPPGTIITYSFEIEDSKGNRLDTQREEFIFQDARFEWKEVSEGPVTVSYHGPVKRRAEIVLASIMDALKTMGPILAAATDEPIRVTMYNNVKEMLEALPPRSATVGRELITEGQAFTDIGTLLVLGGGRLAEGTAAHEVTHILVHRAGDSVFRRVPAWLNEGLAEYGNAHPGFSYDIALDFAVATGRLLPVVFMTVLPGNPEDIIVFYGQSRSIVRMMVDRFGTEKMTELIATLKRGKKVDDAVQEVYGLDLLALDTMWRESIGAAPYVPPKSGRARPTPLPWPTVLPYSLTPQPDAESIGAKADTPTPTPTAEPQPTPTSEPVAVAARPDPPAEPAAPAQAEPEKQESASGSCNAPLNGESGPLDVATAGILFGLAGLWYRRRPGSG